MDDDSQEVRNDWQATCTDLMALATGAVIYGSLPSLIRMPGSNEFGLRDLLHILI
jgi:hypothetical protein